MSTRTDDLVESIAPRGEPARTKYQPDEPTADELSELIWADIERVSGAPCFRGTRVPIQILFDHVRFGELDEFLEGYPDITRERAQAVIDLAARLLIAQPFRR